MHPLLKPGVWRPLANNAPACEEDNAVEQLDFVDQVRCPNNRSAIVMGYVAHVLDDCLATRLIKAVGGLVQQQKVGMAKQRARHFHAALIATGQRSHCAVQDSAAM